MLYLLLVVGMPVFAPQLTRDLEAGVNNDFNADVQWMTYSGGYLYFRAGEPIQGYELWRSDGTPEGTNLVADICVGPNGSNPTWLADVNGTLVFAADDCIHGRQLWISNGSPDTTRMVRDTIDGNASDPQYMVAVGSNVLFAGNGPAGGFQLWRSDLTSAGTQLVASSAIPGWPLIENGLGETPFAYAGGKLFFRGYDSGGTFEWELFASDGTSGATFIDLNPGQSYPFGLTAFSPNGEPSVALIATTPDGHKVHIVRASDLSVTVDGTCGPGNFDPNGLSALPNDPVAFFSANEDCSGQRELYYLDAGGAHLIDANPFGGSNPGDIRSMGGGRAVFRGYTPAVGEEAMLAVVSNGAAGAVGIADVAPGGNSTSPFSITALPLETCGESLALLDGVGGALTGMPNPGSNNLTIEFWAVADGDLIVGKFGGNHLSLSIDGGTARAELEDSFANMFAQAPAPSDHQWHHYAMVRSDTNLTLFIDGESVDTQLDPTDDLQPSGPFAIGNDLGVFSSHGVIDEVRVWSDAHYTSSFSPLRCASAFGASGLVAEWMFDEGFGTAVADSSGNGNDGGLVGAAGFANYNVVYRGFTPGESRVAHTSATENSRTFLADFNGNYDPFPFLFAGGTIYLSANIGTGRELFKLASNQVQQVAEVGQTLASANVDWVVAHNGRTLFAANSGGIGRELFQSDGSPLGTRVLFDLQPQNGSGSNPRRMMLIDERLFFGVSVYGLSRLWTLDLSISDATPQELFAFDSGVGGEPNPFALARFPNSNVLFFGAHENAIGWEPWRSDGTPEGTSLLADLDPGDGFAPDEYGKAVACGNTYVYFVGQSPGFGREVWRATPSSVERITDFNGAGGGDMRQLVAIGSTLYFSTSNFENALYKLDCDALTPVPQLLRFFPSLNSPLSGFFTAFGQLYFVANDPNEGEELWTSDGSAMGTVSVDVNAIYPGTGSSAPTGFYSSGTRLFFSAFSPATGRELWQLDPDSGAISQASDIAVGSNTSNPGTPFGLFDGNTFLFAADDAVSGIEPWLSWLNGNGDRQYRMLTDMMRGPRGSFPRAFTLAGNKVFFSAYSDSTGDELWTLELKSLDRTPPRITVCPSGRTVDATSEAGVDVPDLADTLEFVEGEDPAAQVTRSPDGTLPFGTTPVQFTVRDWNGNQATCNAAVTVQDVTPPQINCPLPITAEVAGSFGALVSFAATATDDVTPAPGVSYNAQNPFPFGPSGTLVTATATDSQTNNATCDFTVTVVDTVAPAITCPSDVVAQASAASGAIVTFASAQASDVSGSVSVGYSQDPGTQFTFGSSTVTATATDAAGNTANCTFDVDVIDTLAPVLLCPGNRSVAATSATGAVIALSGAVASDAVTAAPTVSFSPTSGSSFPFGTTLVTATATDAALNTTSCTFSVTVTDDTSPSITCPSTVAAEATSAAGADVTFPDATASDGASTPTVSYSHANGSTFPLGVTVVTATATDAASHTASCTFSVVVGDTTAPAIVCPADVTVETTGQGGAVVGFAAPMVSESNAVLAYSHNAGALFPLGTTTVTVAARDAAGNSASCSFNVTVQDTVAPVLSCPGDITVEGTSSNGANVRFDGDVSDASGLATLHYSIASGSLFASGQSEVTAVASDPSGNTAQCTFKVTVVLSGHVTSAQGCAQGGDSAAWALLALLACVRARRRPSRT